MSLKNILHRYFYPGNTINNIGSYSIGDSFGTLEEESELLETLRKAEIQFTRKIAVTGTQYWKVYGHAFRLADHFKPGGEVYNGTEVSSWKDLLRAIKKIPNIDLSDKSKRKADFYNKVLASPSKYFNTKTSSNGVKVFVIKGTNRMFEDLNDAIMALYYKTFLNN